MDFNDFISEVKEFTEKMLGDLFEVRVNEVIKNNNIKLHGLSIIKKGDFVGPNIYLEGYYELYINGMTIEEICQDVKKTYEQANLTTELCDIHNRVNYDAQKNFIIYRLINYEKNRELLENMPHYRFLDMAVTFQCLVNYGKDGISTLPINNEIMDYWQLNKNELLKLALENTEKLLPISIRTIEEVLIELFEINMERIMSCTELLQEEANDYYEQMRVTVEELKTNDEVDMYVISNKIGINGACVLLYQKSFEEFVEKIGGEVFILPSSIHELIVVPVLENVCPEKLMEMVQEVNETHLPVEDVLSEHVYRYSIINHTFEIL